MARLGFQLSCSSPVSVLLSCLHFQNNAMYAINCDVHETKMLRPASIEPWPVFRRYCPPASNCFIYNWMSRCWGHLLQYSEALWLHSQNCWLASWNPLTVWTKGEVCQHAFENTDNDVIATLRQQHCPLARKTVTTTKFFHHLIFRESMQLETSSKFLRNLHKAESSLSCAE